MCVCVCVCLKANVIIRAVFYVIYRSQAMME